MSKSVLISFTIALLICSVSSCKKGDNDPFFSLRSRKNRVAGEWRVSSSETKYVYYGYNNTISDVYLYNGTTENQIYTYSSETQNFSSTSSREYSLKFIFEKDGTYKQIYTDSDESSTINGVWIFLGKNKEIGLKNKEAISLSVTSDNYYTTNQIAGNGNNNSNNVYLINQLKNKEMILTIYLKTNSNIYETKMTLTRD